MCSNFKDSLLIWASIKPSQGRCGVGITWFSRSTKAFSISLKSYMNKVDSVTGRIKDRSCLQTTNMWFNSSLKWISRTLASLTGSHFSLTEEKLFNVLTQFWINSLQIIRISANHSSRSLSYCSILTCLSWTVCKPWKTLRKSSKLLMMGYWKWWNKTMRNSLIDQNHSC